MRPTHLLCSFAVCARGVSAVAIPPAAAQASAATLSMPGQTQAPSLPSAEGPNTLLQVRQQQDNDNDQIQQLQQQLQQEQQRDQQSVSSLSSSFSSRLSSISSSASSVSSQLQTSIQSAQQSIVTLQQNADAASRSAASASQSASSAISAVQSSAASAQASLMSSMLASAASAEQVFSVSMSQVMVAAVASASASASAAVVAEQASINAASSESNAGNGLGSDPAVDGAAQDQQPPTQAQQKNALGACSTPEVVLAFAGIIIGAIGMASLGCTIFLWWRRGFSLLKKDSSSGSGNKSSGVSGGSRSSGGSSRQWRIRASTSPPKTGSTKATRTTAMSPGSVSLSEYKLPAYQRLFPESTKPPQASKETSKAAQTGTTTQKPLATTAAAAPNASTIAAPAPVAAAVTSNDRIYSTWSFTTAGGDNNNSNNNNNSTFFDASSTTSSARDTVPPLQPVRASRNFSRGSRAVMGAGAATTTTRMQPRPTSSVYEPYGGLGLDRISRLEDEWNRSANGNKSSYYMDDQRQATRQQQKSSRFISKGSADSLVREYHDFVSQLAPPTSTYGLPGAATGTASQSDAQARNRAQLEPTLPPSAPLPGLPGNSGSFEIRPYNQGLI